MEFLLQIKQGGKCKMAKKFLRRIWGRYSKLGKRRKKKQVWRKPTGRDNKMREKRKGYPAVVNVGYKKDKKSKGNIEGKTPVLVQNVKDLESIKKHEIAIVGNIGKKKKIEIAKKAKEMKIEIYNLNIKTFLKKIDKTKENKK
jgi:large subunit ribosomal protein L32e